MRCGGGRCGNYTTNLSEEDPAKLWEQYIQLTEVETAFRTLKSEVGLRPVYHWVGPRVEGHVMLAFMAYAMWVSIPSIAKPSLYGWSLCAPLVSLETLRCTLYVRSRR